MTTVELEQVESRGCCEPPPALTLRALQGRARQPLSATPRTLYRAAHDSGPRPLSSITLLVIHDEEAWTALSSAAWFANPRSRASCHECIDAIEAYQTLPANRIPWGAPGANLRGYHLELAGFARWTQAEWLEQGRGTLERAAYRAAQACRRHKIPARWLTDAQLRRGEHGITTHAQITRVLPGGSHTDPGHGFPATLFLQRINHHLKGRG